MSEQAEDDSAAKNQLFPLIQGILAFDTPYNGLARSMFVYGAFSQYQKVSSVWNIMSATSAGLLSVRSLSSVSKLSSGTAARSAMSVARSPGWKTWQNLAVKSGAVGAIAAGGVAAYRNREAIVKSIRNMNRSSIKDGAAQGYNALGEGLAYINRDNVGQSFAWLSSHFKFVGALMRQKELMERLERLAALKGIGVRNIYTSMGENGYWTGGYFVPERTFCAIPASGQDSNDLFTRNVNTLAEDEIQAHISMFRPELNDNYEHMSETARDLVVSWFLDDAELIDPPKVENTPPVTAEASTVQDAEGSSETEIENLEESPLDIAATAATIPLPEPKSEEAVVEKQTYLQNLMRISARAGNGLSSTSGAALSVAGTGISYIPVPSLSTLSGASAKLPSMPAMPSFSKPKLSSLWGAKKSAEQETEIEGLDGPVGEDEAEVTVDVDDDVHPSADGASDAPDRKQANQKGVEVTPSSAAEGSEAPEKDVVQEAPKDTTV